MVSEKSAWQGGTTMAEESVKHSSTRLACHEKAARSPNSKNIEGESQSADENDINVRVLSLSIP